MTIADAQYVAEYVAVLRQPAAGRLRLSVFGLRHRSDRQEQVEVMLRRVVGVKQVRASATTGNVLVELDVLVVDEVEFVIRANRCLGEAFPDDTVAAHTAASRPSGPAALLRRLFSKPPRSQRRSPSRSQASVEPPSGVSATTWHATEVVDVASALGTDTRRGLEPDVVAERRLRFGPNQLAEPAEPSLLKLFLSQFINAPSALLGAGAVMSVITGGIVDAVLISAVLVANAVIGTATERAGERAIAALRRTVTIHARVRRGGGEQVVDAEELVPGDLISLAPGVPVPADARVVWSHDALVEESVLTGESFPVPKLPDAVATDAAMFQRSSMLYRGTTLVGGRADAVVVATGPDTVMSGLRLLAAQAQPPPAPLARDLDHLGGVMAVGATALCAATFGLAALRGVGLLQAASTAVALAIAAIPEGLAAIATTVLALSSGRMRQRGTLIRSLGAAEALGAVTVVCADKTGTITESRMVARRLAIDGISVDVDMRPNSPKGQFLIDGRRVDPTQTPGVIPTLKAAVLCSDASLVIHGDQVEIDGSPTEGALLMVAAGAGLDIEALRASHPRVDGRDRSSGRRHMLTVHKNHSGLTVHAKGSPEEILAMCARVSRNGSGGRLDAKTRRAIVARNTDLAGQGLRVLAFAMKRLPKDYSEGDLDGGYSWLGLIGLEDPIRPSVPRAVTALHGAGIRTVMITGDQAATAVAVARRLRLTRREPLTVLETSDLASLDPAELGAKVRDVGVFARVTPELKLSIVRALQANGEVVAMTGDGVNDGPALRAADVGVAMGERGSELARELADVVLSTDDFARMVDAVEEGRLVRHNVRRVLHYLLATNASEVLAVTGAIALGLPSPLTALQLLWLNIVTDVGPAVGLATEPAPANLLRRPPRDPKEPIITRPLWRQLAVEAGLIALGALGVYGVGLARHGRGAIAQTMAFASLTGAQLMHAPLARDPLRATADPLLRRNRTLRLGLGVSLALQAAALLFPPLRIALGGAAIGLGDVLVSAIGSLAPIAAIQGLRTLRDPGQLRDLALPIPSIVSRIEGMSPSTRARPVPIDP